jgi:O-antigen/teichoic acid export membrane protein
MRGDSALITIRELVAPFASVGMLRALALLSSMLASVIVARHLGPTAYGQVAFVLAILSLCSIPSNNALTPLLIRQTSSYQQVRDWRCLKGFVDWSRNAALVSALLCMAVLLLWVAWSFTYLLNDYTRLLLIGAPLILLWAGAGRITGILQGLNKVVIAQLFDWLITPFGYLLLILLLLWIGGLSAESVVTSTVVSVTLSVVIGWFVLRAQIPKEVFDESGEVSTAAWFSAWRSFAIIQAVNVVNLRAPVLLLGLFATAEEAGLYRVADNIASLLSLTLIVINSVIGPRIAGLYAEGKLDELSHLAKNTARLALGVSLPIIIAVLVFGEWILQFLFGRAYTEAYLVLVVLVVGQVVNIATGSVGLIMNMTGHEKSALNTWSLALIVTIGLGAMLVPYFGALGAAIAATVATIVWNVLLLVKANKVVGSGVSIF